MSDPKSKSAGKKGGGGSAGDRPFYELPAHIKPCSRIIHETRLQLSTQSKSASFPRPPSQLQAQDRFSSAPPSHSHSHAHAHTHPLPLSLAGGDTFANFYQDPDSKDQGTSTSTRLGGLRVVQTHRPKTGTDHDSTMLWGVSSRKRPPSAITLSTLSLDDNEEDSQWTDPDSKMNQERSSIHSAVGLGLGSLLPLSQRQRHAHGTTIGGIGGVSLDSALSPNGVDDNLGSGRQTRLNVKSKSGKKKSAMSKTKSLSISNMRGQDQDQHQNQNQHEGSREGGDFVEGEDPEEEGLLRAELIQAMEELNYIVDCETSQRPLKDEIIEGLQRVKKCIGALTLKGVEFGGSLRQRLLRTIFRLVETHQSDEDVIFWASFVLLHCRILGKNLTTVFKMVFKASRWKEYWRIIAQTEYLDVFMDSFARICPLTQTESMIYGYGTLKFISMDKDVLLRVLQLDLVPIMTLHLKLVNYELQKVKGKVKGEVGVGVGEKGVSLEVGENMYNAAFQLTSILRSVVGEESSLKEVVRTGLLFELCNSLWWTFQDIDVLSNIVRILSVVSSGDEECCAVICANDVFAQTVVDMMDTWDSKEDIIVRLTYTLGNLLAFSEDMRLKLFQEPGCYSVVLHLIAFYLDASSSGANGKQPSQRNPMAEDILIKSIRILANWSLNPAIGSEIAEDDDVSHILNTIIAQDQNQSADDQDEEKTMTRARNGNGHGQGYGHSDELLVCVMSTLNNVTFYKDYLTRDVETTLETAQNLYPFLTWAHVEGRTEVMKVLGNLTRNDLIRKWVGEGDHVDKLMESLKWGCGRGKGEEELISATLGVLMNVIVDTRASQRFLRNNGIQLLMGLLERKTQLGLVLMICQFLWNIQVSTSNPLFWKGSRDGGGGGGSEREEDPLAPVKVTVGSEDEEEGGMSIKQRLEIRGLLRRKLEGLDLDLEGENQNKEGGVIENEGEEELVEELRLVGGRLLEKLGE